MNALKGKVAWITGGGSGIGRSVAKMFCMHGAKVAISGRSEEKLQAVAQEFGAGTQMTCHALDVADKDQVQKVARDVVKQHGPIDILVNNAGTNLKDRRFRSLTPEGWDKLIRTNLDGAFYCIHAVLESMLERKSGFIVNVSSIAGKRASPLGGTAYSASKFGMTSLGLCLGMEEKDSGVRVTNIYPGEVDTPILEMRPNPVSDEHRQQILQADDVASAVVFVCSLPPRASVPELIIKPTTQAYG